MSDINIRFKKVHPDARLPEYASPGDAGADLRAWLPDGQVVLKPGNNILVSTGFSMEIPDDFEAQIRPRSGLALKNMISVLNAPGTIDENYRGIVGVILINHGQEDFLISQGDRIAQMVIAPVVRFTPEVVDKLSTTSRGDGGFGSTGRA